MADLEWFSYSGQTTDELLALEGKYRTDSLVVAIEEALMCKSEESLSNEERIVIAIEELQREVNNGGYDLFFSAAQAYVSIVVDALKRIGCDAEAALTQEAIDILCIVGPLTVEALDLVMADESDERDDALNACDERYYATAGDLSDPLWEFIKKNREQIQIGE